MYMYMYAFKRRVLACKMGGQGLAIILSTHFFGSNECIHV